MDLNYKTVNIFPSFVHLFDVNGFDEIKNQLIDYAYDFKKRDPEGVSFSNEGGWQSPDFSVNDENDVLHHFLINCLAGFPVIDESFNIKLRAWVNINKPGDCNIKHNHPTCDLAGVLWIKCPENSGNIIFYNPTGFEAFNEINSYNSDFKNKNNFCHTYLFPPVEGRILIFPSHLQHRVKKNMSNEDRISVSFNLQLINK